MTTVKLRFRLADINTRGEIDTGIDKEDWDDMDDAGKNNEVQHYVNQLIDIEVVED